MSFAWVNSLPAQENPITKLVLFDYEDTLCSSNTGEPMPGVIDLLSTLHEKGVAMGIVTGAYTEFATEFAAKYGIDKYFAPSGKLEDQLIVGSDLGGSLYTDRLSIAIRAAERMCGHKFKNEDIFAFDDRESRISVAENMGIRFIAVATGDSRVCDFQKSNPRPYRTFKDLTETADIVSTIFELDLKPRRIR